MIHRLLPLLVFLAMVGPASATILLNESHGSTWISWDWNITELTENQVLLGRFDGQEVVNLSHNSTHPLVSGYHVRSLETSEPHIFDLIMLNVSADPATVEETVSSSVTTGQAESNFFIYLGAGLLLCLIGFFFGRANRIVALFLFVVALFCGGYTVAATAGSNVVLFGFGLIVVLLSLAGLVYAFLDMTRERRGWGGE